jgi:hypothetical protein
MNFGSLINETLYGSRLYIMCAETSSYVSSYRRGDMWNVGVMNVQLFAVGIGTAENYFKRVDTFYLNA